MAKKISAFLILWFAVSSLLAGPEKENESHSHSCHEKTESKFDPAATAMHHISDANVYSILEVIKIPLPTILKSDNGWDIFLSSKFEVGHHEDGHKSYNGYVLHHGSVHRVVEEGFPMTGQVEVDGFTHHEKSVNNKIKSVPYVCYSGKEYELHTRTTLDGGIMGGGISSFWDFSITKNVLAMILVSLLLFWMFVKAAKQYKSNALRAPKGLQNVLETMVTFIRDEVAIPFIGKDKYMKFLPFLLSLFFFILGLNLFGQIPFLGSVNATGNLSLTLILALLAFIVTNIMGKKTYWQHILWMPGVPKLIRPLLTGVEIMGMFIKPLTLMLRLAGNISAGHIAILSFVGLIFIFGDMFGNIGNGVGTLLSIPLTMFMMGIELIVAFIQAFVFTILTASYIGAAIEEHH